VLGRALWAARAGPIRYIPYNFASDSVRHLTIEVRRAPSGARLLPHRQQPSMIFD